MVVCLYVRREREGVYVRVWGGEGGGLLGVEVSIGRCRAAPGSWGMAK